MDFNYEYNLKKELVEAEIKRNFNNVNFQSESLKEIMEYAVLNGGKRLRPILFLSTYSLCRDDYKEALGFSVALEFIHCYSLVHDDLPAMDNDDLRRGNPTCHIKFSHYGAILAGDALLNYAFETMLSNKGKFKDENLIRAMSIIGKSSGAMGMCAGQMSDMEQSVDTFEKLTKMYKNKTGALLKASILGGYYLSGGDLKYDNILDEFADLLGLIFQIKDDVLDVVSTNEVLGKPVHSDEKNDKLTFVSKYGIEECNKKIDEYVKKAIDLLDMLPYDTQFLKEMVLFMGNRNY